MNEGQQIVRPTKKQRELLEFIARFIAAHGYSPSYREIMSGLNYTSVATVALHVNSLITRGHLRKREGSARSLEVVNAPVPEKVAISAVQPAEEKWLTEKVGYFFKEAESSGELTDATLDQLHVLVGALKILKLEGAAQSFSTRLAALRKRAANSIKA